VLNVTVTQRFMRMVRSKPVKLTPGPRGVMRMAEQAVESANQQ
jgi:hypothetical protein